MRSTGTTAVAPSGTAPPVEIATVAPGLTATRGGMARARFADQLELAALAGETA